MTEPAWTEYVAAAQRLDEVRRSAARLATERERARGAARDELAALRARLAPQRARLRELGVDDAQLNAAPEEVAGAARMAGRDATSVLATLRQARATADSADAAVLAPPRSAAGPAAPWQRNLLVYAPFALVVFVIQMVLYIAADEALLPRYAAACGLTMPAAAFGLGWLITGLAFPPGPSGRVERTPLVGFLVCFAPVLVTCVGVGALAVLR
jgi:hypothetical protein